MPRRAKESAVKIESGSGCAAPEKPKRRSKKSVDEITSAPAPSPSSESSKPEPGTSRSRKSRRNANPDPITEDTGYEEPAVPSGLVCGFCGRSYRVESQELIPVELHGKFGDRYLDMPEIMLCKECVAHLPDYLAGALHLGLRIPRDNYSRKGFMYPPFQMCIERPAKPVKMSDLVPWIKK